MKSKWKIPAKSWGAVAPEEQTVIIIEGIVFLSIVYNLFFFQLRHSRNWYPR